MTRERRLPSLRYHQYLQGSAQRGRAPLRAHAVCMQSRSSVASPRGPPRDELSRHRHLYVQPNYTRWLPHLPGADAHRSYNKLCATGYLGGPSQRRRKVVQAHLAAALALRRAHSPPLAPPRHARSRCRLHPPRARRRHAKARGNLAGLLERHATYWDAVLQSRCLFLVLGPLHTLAHRLVLIPHRHERLAVCVPKGALALALARLVLSSGTATRGECTRRLEET